MLKRIVLCLCFLSGSLIAGGDNPDATKKYLFQQGILPTFFGERIIAELFPSKTSKINAIPPALMKAVISYYKEHVAESEVTAEEQIIPRKPYARCYKQWSRHYRRVGIEESDIPIQTTMKCVPYFLDFEEEMEPARVYYREEDVTISPDELFQRDAEARGLADCMAAHDHPLDEFTGVRQLPDRIRTYAACMVRFDLLKKIVEDEYGVTVENPFEKESVENLILEKQ